MRATLLLLAVLALSGCDRQKSGSSQADAPAGAPAVAKVGLDRSHAGSAMPGVEFRDPDGEPTSLQAFKGKPLLLNLWATWCAPCIRELPTLASLAGRDGAPQVLALSQDMQPQPTVAAFLDERKITLEPFQDPDMAMSTALAASILPTTVLYGADGREVWRYTGDLDWTGQEAARLLKEAR